MKDIVLWGSIACLSVCVAALWMSTAPSFAVVDLTLLLSQKAQVLAKGGIVSPQQIQEAGEKLREELTELAEANGVIVLPKSVVFGGRLRDLTPEVEGRS